MLERECHNVLDTLERLRVRIPGEAFADNDLDPSRIVASVPADLVHHFFFESWKFEQGQLARTCQVCYDALVFATCVS